MSRVLKNQPFTGSLKTSEFITRGLPRNLEFLLAAVGLIVLSPVLLLCALLVWFSSPGGIFFRQSRTGQHGKTFTLYKFRTMVISKDGLLITAATDCRITRVGRILRQWKLDELPEFYNVLRGEMSFVGPRPEVPELVDFSNPAWDTILKRRPGITDPVTLCLRNEEAFLANVEDKEAFYREVIQPFKLNGYLEYLETKSLKNDLKIVVQTVKVILLPRTAPTPTLEKVGFSAVE
jgi:lipopolysaccharide/colanic/teichoic acid biosynthesis glycosyltransferase